MRTVTPLAQPVLRCPNTGTGVVASADGSLACVGDAEAYARYAARPHRSLHTAYGAVGTRPIGCPSRSTPPIPTRHTRVIWFTTRPASCPPPTKPSDPCRGTMRPDCAERRQGSTARRTMSQWRTMLMAHTGGTARHRIGLRQSIWATAVSASDSTIRPARRGSRKNRVPNTSARREQQAASPPPPRGGADAPAALVRRCR